MKRSASDSRRRKPSSLRRSRPLKRKVSLAPLAEEHFAYAYAAYKKGAFDEMYEKPDGLTPAGFRKWILEIAGHVIAQDGEIITAMDEQERPAAFVMLNYAENPAEGKPFAFPHALWFPWISPRTKLTLALHFFLELKKQHMGIVAAKGPNVKFFEHLSKYGVIRPVGWFYDYFGPGQRARMFQTVGD